MRWGGGWRQGGVVGLVPTLRVFNATARLCDQVCVCVCVCVCVRARADMNGSGCCERVRVCLRVRLLLRARTGACAGYNPQVFEFLELRKNTGAEGEWVIYI